MASIIHTSPILEGSTAELSLELGDERNIPISTPLSSLTLTYYDLVTREIINGRDNQSILDENDGVYGDYAIGDVEVTFTANSRRIVRSSGTWLSHSLKRGTVISVSNTSFNDGLYTVRSVSVTDILVEEPIVDEEVEGTFSIPGSVTWNLTTDDTVIVDSRRKLEDHIALFHWTWDSGDKSGYQEVRFTIENLHFVP